MRNIKLILEYDGSDFFGFQRQTRKRTVQSELESAFSKLFNRKTKISAASGRTDSGVHALGQVVNFKTESALNLERIQKGLNRYLPKTVSVTKAEEAEEDFHARFHARNKVYEYHVWNHPARSPLRIRQAYHFPYKLSLTKMRTAARALKGRHDFKAFCASDRAAREQNKTTVRTIQNFQIKREGDLLIFRVQADGFLYHMVRNLVGTLLEIGQGKRPPGAIRGILASRDRRKAGRTAPADGLFLVNVNY